jgi:germination protein M
MKRWKHVLLLVSLLMACAMLSGCLFGSSQDSGSEAIDPPQEDYLSDDEIEFEFEEGAEEETSKEEQISDDQEESNEDGKETGQTVDRTIYVFDHEGHVVPLTIKVPHTDGVAKQALEYLVVDGPVTEQLPDGMRAVLPAGTELSVKIEGNTAVVDFSPEFKNYQPEDEKGILEAITYTLTEFDTIENVKIMINGYVQETMPVNGTPINQPLSRKDGINLEIAEGTQIGHSSAVTLYFLAQSPSGQFDYFVPVTRLIPKTDDLVKATVDQLKSGPQVGSGLYSLISDDLDITETTLEKDLAILRFSQTENDESSGEELLSDQAVDSLVLSLTEIEPVQKVQVMVDGDQTESAQPVSRPGPVNAASF